MRYFITIAFYLVTAEVMAQVIDTVLFTHQVELDTSSREAEPVGGYKHLFLLLEQKISAGDTVGKKFSIPLYAIRFRISKTGDVDTAYVGIPHAACPIHRMVARELLKTKWLPAKVRGRPVPYEDNLPGRIKLTKTVQKQFRCRWG